MNFVDIKMRSTTIKILSKLLRWKLPISWT